LGCDARDGSAPTNEMRKTRRKETKAGECMGFICR
jgi:hypothetical protein